MSRRKFTNGKTTEDLLKMDYSEFQRLSKSELREVVSRLADTANKRLKRLAGSETPATMQAARSGGAFSTKGKSIQQLRKEYARARSFLQNPTSSKKKEKEYREKFKQEIPGATDEQYMDFWKLFNQLRESDPQFHLIPPSDLIKMIHNEIENNPKASFEQHFRNLTERMTERYEEVQKSRKQVDISSFFETG